MLEKNDITKAHSTYSTKKETKLVHAKKAEAFLQTVCDNAAAVGMIVNPSKTQILCTSTAINSDVRSYVNLNSDQIISKDSLKSDGYKFGW